VKTESEIYRYHDILEAILHKEVPNPFPKNEDAICAAHDALCWVLEHENPSFAKSMKDIEAYLAAKGFVLNPPLPFPQKQDAN
jgi:hypothetical protein